MRAKIIKVEDGLGYSANDEKYIRPHLNNTVNLTPIAGKFGFFVTDCPVDGKINNDYVHDGFLVVSVGNLGAIEK